MNPLLTLQMLTLTVPTATAGPVAVFTVPVAAAAAAVVVTGVGVWLAMLCRRLGESRRRLWSRNRELAAERDRLAGELVRLRGEHGELSSTLCLQEDKTELLRRRNRTLEKILVIAARINATRSLPELLEKVVGAVQEVIGFRRVILHLWSDETQAFEARAFAGVQERYKAALTAMQVPRGEYDEFCHPRHRFSNSYLVRAGEPGEAPAGGEPTAGPRPWTDDLLLISPLISSAGEVVGYLSLDAPGTGRVPGIVEIKQLEFLVQQATTAIQSAEVYDRLARNNAELSLASEKLASLSDMKANFVANVSHELRTPLTSISAYTELLQQNMDTMSEEARREFLKVINAESSKLTAIINDLLELSRIENGRPTQAAAETDLVAQIRHLEDSWRGRATDRNIRFELAVSAQEIRLQVDALLLQQLLGHLLGNAFKFTPAGGRVRLALEETGTAVRITVEDTGIGIPADKLGEIFDRFFQVDGSATREHNGQGVGLAICHDIVHHHDGRIWAENIEPRGARFTVLLPRRPSVVLAAVAPISTAPFEPGEFMQRLMHWVSESLGIQMATLMMPDADGEHLSIRAAIGLPETVVQSARVRLGTGYAGRAWATGRTLLIEDVTADDRLNRDISEPRYSTPSLLCVPLITAGECAGVISVNNKIDGSPLDEDDRVFLEALAPNLARLLLRHRDWQDEAVFFHDVRETLRATTAVGHLRHESILEICQEICLATARRILLPPEEMEHLALALQFYDVGLGAVPLHLLRKPGRLERHEECVVRQHVAASLEILQPLEPDSKVRQLILHHHENFDGSGYPAGLAGEAIPLGSRLVRLTDTLGALLSRRPWRGAFTLDQAMAELRAGSGLAFCPRMTDLFLRETELRRERIVELQGRQADDRDLTRPVPGQVVLVP